MTMIVALIIMVACRFDDRKIFYGPDCLRTHSSDDNDMIDPFGGQGQPVDPRGSSTINSIDFGHLARSPASRPRGVPYPRVIYADKNCCGSSLTVRQSIFPEMTVRLDAFHVMRRFNKGMCQVDPRFVSKFRVMKFAMRDIHFTGVSGPKTLFVYFVVSFLRRGGLVLYQLDYLTEVSSS